MPKISQFDAERALVIGQNVRAIRLQRGWSISSLAHRAKIAPYTLLRVEKGQPSSIETQSRIADALDTHLARLDKADGASRPYYRTHLPPDDEWQALIDRRPKAPLDTSLTQDAKERDRLGHLGFVPQFVKVLKCRLPQGKLAPGILEIYDDLPTSQYLGGEIFAYALRGDSVLMLDGEAIELPLGSAVTFDCTKPFFFRRAVGHTDREAPLVLYVRRDDVVPLAEQRRKRNPRCEPRTKRWGS